LCKLKKWQQTSKLTANKNSLTIKLLRFGIISPLLFWEITIISGLMLEDYDHLKNVISDLGMIGTKSAAFSQWAFAILSVFCLLFSLGLIKAVKQIRVSIIPALLTLAFPIVTIWGMVLYPLPDPSHSALGAMPLLINLGALLGFILLRKKEIEGLSRIRLWSIISFLVTMLIALRFTSFGMEFQGLVQRFFYLGWSIWFISLSVYFIKEINGLKYKSRKAST